MIPPFRAALCAALLTTVVAQSPAPKPLTAVDFFAVIHPYNYRSPDWPESLNFQVDREITVTKLERLLQQNLWRTAYECDGRPALFHPSLFDGISNGIQEMEFSGQYIKAHTRALNADPASERTYAYRISSSGDARFLMTFPDEDYLERRFSVVIVKETGERVLIFDAVVPGTCPRGKPSRSIRVPTARPNS